MTYEQALLVQRLLDTLHNPSWSVGFIIMLIFIFEGFIAKNNPIFFKNSLFAQKAKVFLMYWYSVVAFTQAIFKGCVIHIPQNWIAREYMGLEYWHPYGLVYREVIPESILPFIPFLYFGVGLFLLWRGYKFQKDFV